MGPINLLRKLDLRLRPDKRPRKLLGLEAMAPMQVEVCRELEGSPHLNVLLPRLSPRSLTGGPNTALVVAAGAAGLGMPVRLLALDEAAPTDPEWLRSHIASVAGVLTAPPIAFGSSVDPSAPFRIGPSDVFMATYWTTAFRLKPILPRMAVQEFIYLIQDFEPGFYAWSSAYAQALETYSMPFKALINEQLLADHLCETRSGLFGDRAFLAACAVFEPAVDRMLFHPTPAPDHGRRLLFYARPNRPRNLFDIGFEALRAASAQPPFGAEDWSFVSIGDPSLGVLDLGGGRTLEPSSWLGFQDYARLMRESDILLCPMLSPHTSYPVLEMAACRGIAVTNTFGPKTPERLAAISPRIVAGAPTIEALAAGIVRAAEHVAADNDPHVDIDLPGDWPTALGGAVLATHGMFQHAVQGGRAGVCNSF